MGKWQLQATPALKYHVNLRQTATPSQAEGAAKKRLHNTRDSTKTGYATFAISGTEKGAGMQYCCNFCYFYCLKRRGNAILLPFFLFLAPKKARECDTVASLAISGT